MTAIAVLAALAALAVVALWVAQSLIRMTVASVAVAVTHSPPPLWLAAALAVALATVAAVILYRVLSGGLMVMPEVEK